MNNFFKSFFASLLALVVFSLLFMLVLVGFSASFLSKPVTQVGNNAVLVLDLEQNFNEINSIDPFSSLFDMEALEQPTVYDLILAIKHAASNEKIKGIYIKAGISTNGMAVNEEIRSALEEFKSSGKFIYAYGETITQSAYYVANVADKIYCNPLGSVDWSGFSMSLVFLKDALDRLEIKPQIFYAGKFKSATEPFREKKMTEPNRIQNKELLDDLYNHFLKETAEARGLNTDELKALAVEGKINFASDALNYKLIDGLRYDDEVREEIREITGAEKITNINFISVKKYLESGIQPSSAKDRIAVIFAEGNIVDGEADRSAIGSKNYIQMVRKARLDDRIKAIVFRINSGGGSALASENILRELSLAKKEKPVILSFGDVAASGGYYLAVAADSIFVQPNTITGSIGVFSLIPNFEDFMSKKLGVTFDEVYSAAPPLTATKPLTPQQREMMQMTVDSIYTIFKTRVSEGRGLNIDYVDSIAQGRIWSGSQAIKLGLADKIGGLNDAIASAAAMAGTESYSVRRFPEKIDLFQFFLSSSSTEELKNKMITEEFPAELSGLLNYYREIKSYTNAPQTRMPFSFTIQ